MTTTWSPADIDALAVLADVILPGNGTLPKASEAGIARWIVEALRLRPDLHDLASAALAQFGTAPDPALALADARGSAELDALVVLLTGAYCMSPVVWELLGYEGQEAREVRDDTESYVDLLLPVFERGERYRPTP